MHTITQLRHERVILAPKGKHVCGCGRRCAPRRGSQLPTCVRPRRAGCPHGGPGRKAVHPCSPVVWIHDGNEEDIEAIPLIKSDLVVCWTSQDLIRDIWPLQGNFVVGVVAAHVVLGKGQVCSQAVGLGRPRQRPPLPLAGAGRVRARPSARWAGWLAEATQK